MRIMVWLWIVLIMACETDKVSKTGSKSSHLLFKEVPSSHSCIQFQNKLTENLSTGDNILDFDYFFNGAGVAVADFDNDGLEDLFFTAN